MPKILLRPEIHNVENPIGKERILNIEPLSPKDITSISEILGIEEGETTQLVRRGLGMLGTSEITTGTIFFSADDQKLDCNIHLINYKSAPHAICTGNLGVGVMNLYIRNAALREFLEEEFQEGERVQRLSFYYQGKDAQQSLWLAQRFKSHNSAIIRLQNDFYPRNSPLFFYTLQKNGEIYAIFPFWSEVLDTEIGEDAGDIFSKVWLRATERPPDIDFYRQTAAEVTQIIGECNQKLAIPVGLVTNLELILNDDRDCSCQYRPYLNKDEREHHVIFMGRLRIEQMKNKINKQRVGRHEYLHVLDWVLGDREYWFSEMVAAEIVEIINENFPSKERATIELDEKYNIVLESRAFADSTFTEVNVFDDYPEGGHAYDDIKELFASCLNAYCDEDFTEETYSDEESGLYEARKKVYEEIAKLVKKRIGNLQA